MKIHHGTWGSLTIDYTGTPPSYPGIVYWPRIYPTDMATASFGSSAKKFSDAYINYIECNTLVELSDMRVKENIRVIASPLLTILALDGIMFDYIDEYFLPLDKDGSPLYEDSSLKNRYGFSAQATKNVNPNIVIDNGEEFLKINYIDIIPIVVEAMKEQQEIITLQQTAIDLLKQQVSELQKLVVPKEELIIGESREVL